MNILITCSCLRVCLTSKRLPSLAWRLLKVDVATHLLQSSIPCHCCCSLRDLDSREWSVERIITNTLLICFFDSPPTAASILKWLYKWTTSRKKARNLPTSIQDRSSTSPRIYPCPFVIHNIGCVVFLMISRIWWLSRSSGWTLATRWSRRRCFRYAPFELVFAQPLSHGYYILSHRNCIGLGSLSAHGIIQIFVLSGHWM